MSDLFFVIKMFIISVVIMLVMQIRIGPTTLEEKSISMIRNSTLVSHIQDVSQGASILIREILQQVGSVIRTRFGDSIKKENQPGHRVVSLIPDRAVNALKQSASTVADQVKEHAETALEKNKTLVEVQQKQ